MAKKTPRTSSVSKKSNSKKGRSSEELKEFKLGETTTHYNNDYSPSILEDFDNKNLIWTETTWTNFISS